MLEKRVKFPDSSSITLPQTPNAKARASGWRKCSRNCGRFVRARNEDQCTQCRITFVPPPARGTLETVTLSVNGEVQVTGDVDLSASLGREVLRNLLREYSAVQPFPEHVLLSDWDAALLAT
jgi:hypothetical protein